MLIFRQNGYVLTKCQLRRDLLGLEEPTMTDLQKEQIKTLRLQGIGYVKIGEMLGISDNTIRSFCRRNGLGDAAKNTVACKHCGKLFYATDIRSEFCSARCRNQYNVYKSRAKH